MAILPGSVEHHDLQKAIFQCYLTPKGSSIIDLIPIVMMVGGGRTFKIQALVRSNLVTWGHCLWKGLMQFL